MADIGFPLWVPIILTILWALVTLFLGFVNIFFGLKFGIFGLLVIGAIWGLYVVINSIGNVLNNPILVGIFGLLFAIVFLILWKQGLLKKRKVIKRRRR